LPQQLTPAQVTQYYAEEGQAADPLSPLAWLAQQQVPGATGLGEEEIGTSGEEIITTSGEERDKEAEQQAKELEAHVESLKDQDEQIETLTRAQYIAQLQKDLAALGFDLDLSTGAMTPKPPVPSYESDFAALRAEHGLEAIENRMNALKQQAADIEASLRQGLYAEEGKLRPMELIGTRQRELARQGQEELDTINRSLNTLINEYNTKVGIINTTMNLRQLDYEAAKDAYDADFNKAVSILNYIEGKATQAEKEATLRRDDARANLTILSNLIVGSKMTWDELDPSTQAMISSLEVQAELPSGIYSAFLSQEPEAELLATLTGVDAAGNQVASFIYKDEDGKPGIVETVETGIVKPPSATETSKAERDAQYGAIERMAADPANRNASYEALFAAAQKDAPKINDSEIKTILEGAGFKPTVEPQAFLSDKDLLDTAVSYAVRHGKDALKAVGVGKVPYKDERTGKEKQITLSTAQVKSIKNIILNNAMVLYIHKNPDKYKIKGNNVYEIRGGWRTDKVIYSF
jgi:hypothetical protein